MKKRTHRERRKKFLAAWLRAPLSMGSVVPSSRALAKAIAAQVPRNPDGLVLELGPGTGAVTHALREAGVPPEKMVAIEREGAFFAMLAEQYADMRIIHGDALHLEKIMTGLGKPPVAAVVSCLPLLSMSRPVRAAIEEQMARLAGRETLIVQFTYAPYSPLGRAVLRRHGMTGRRVKTVLTNMPPAHVWVYRKT